MKEKKAKTFQDEMKSFETKQQWFVTKLPLNKEQIESDNAVTQNENSQEEKMKKYKAQLAANITIKNMEKITTGSFKNFYL